MRIGIWGVTLLGMALLALPSGAAPRRKAPAALQFKEGATWGTDRKKSGPLRGAPIVNFGEVTPGLVYRGGQPDDAAFRWLKEQGFKSVVCMRKEHDDGAEAMEKAGFRYLYLPVVNEDAPSDKQAETFLRFAANPENLPLFVHCGSGIGRAATMAALVRYSLDGWGMGLALSEARRYRPFSFPLVGRQRAFLNKWAKTHAPGAMRPVSSPLEWREIAP